MHESILGGSTSNLDDVLERLDTLIEGLTLNLITSMRLYDVEMANLRYNNPEVAQKIMEIHSQGAILTHAPEFGGAFIADKVNEESPDGDSKSDENDDSSG